MCRQYVPWPAGGPGSTSQWQRAISGEHQQALPDDRRDVCEWDCCKEQPGSGSLSIPACPGPGQRWGGGEGGMWASATTYGSPSLGRFCDRAEGACSGHKDLEQRPPPWTSPRLGGILRRGGCPASSLGASSARELPGSVHSSTAPWMASRICARDVVVRRGSSLHRLSRVAVSPGDGEGRFGPYLSDD